MEIRLANKNDIVFIVKFHLKQFKNYYLTQLGREILTQYYEFFITSSKNNCFIVEHDGEIVALSLFVIDFDRSISDFYSRYKFSLAKSIFKALIKGNKIVWDGTFERLKNIFFTSKIEIPLPKLTLLSLAVSEPMRGRGIGQTLIKFAEEYYKKHGVQSYYLSVLSYNSKAINFYKKNGFIKLGQSKSLYYLRKKI